MENKPQVLFYNATTKSFEWIDIEKLQLLITPEELGTFITITTLKINQAEVNRILGIEAE